MSTIKVDSISARAGTGTVSLPSGNNLSVAGTVSVTGTSSFTGAITAADIRGTAIKSSNGTTAMTIDTSGRVSRSVVPAFFVYNSTNDWIDNVTAGTLIQFNTAKFNLGNHFNLSTYKFTAPIAGLYQFNVRTYVNNNSSDNAWGVAINDTVYNHSNANYPLFGNLASPGNANDQGANGSHLLNLSANDTVDVRSMVNSTDYFGTMTSFSGFLVG